MLEMITETSKTLNKNDVIFAPRRIGLRVFRCPITHPPPQNARDVTASALPHQYTTSSLGGGSLTSFKRMNPLVIEAIIMGNLVPQSALDLLK